jgi:hypothetical protein
VINFKSCGRRKSGLFDGPHTLALLLRDRSPDRHVAARAMRLRNLHGQRKAALPASSLETNRRARIWRLGGRQVVP